MSLKLEAIFEGRSTGDHPDVSSFTRSASVTDSPSVFSWTFPLESKKKSNLFFVCPLSQNSQHPPLSFSSPLAEVPLLFVFLPSHSFILRQLISPAGISEKWTDSKMERKREEKWIYVHYSLKSEVHNINVHYSCRWHTLNSEGKHAMGLC